MKARETKKAKQTKPSMKPGPSKKEQSKPQKKEEKETPVADPGIDCSFAQLVKVVMDDENGQIKNSGKWPLIIDPNGRVGTFMQYQNTNYLCGLNSKDMSAEGLRMGLLGSLRYGKTFVIDMMEADLFESLFEMYDRVQPGLMKDIMSKEITKEEKYLALVKSSDPDDYQPTTYPAYMVHEFRFILITSVKENLNTSMVEQTFPIRIKMN
ncbi:IQ motif and ankyrin repeat domain-containing protein 1-like [Clavelina lepadiformis]|uniref:Uncharacterized protein n=1 Tax=Clavelina lepadiformis TaxID=159417 RepID=A0ABP0EYP7_CLALP